MTEQILTFGPFRLLPQRQTLLRGQQLVPLGGRALDILIILADRAGEIVGKDELMARVWPDSIVEEASLRVHVAALRKVLGAGGDYIKSVIGRGYCFVAPVQREQAQGEDAAAVPPPSAAGQLPLAKTHLIGRDETVATLVGRLQQRRLITIVGPGGIGKTSVGLAVASAVAEAEALRVCFLDLAPVNDARQLHTALASALGVGVQNEVLTPGLVGFLSSRSMLLMLDSVERLVDPVAILTEAILAGTTATRVIVTSREPLRVRGEWVHRLESLSSPAEATGLTLADAMRFPAVQLFVERAMANWDSFAPTDADAASLCAICRHVDGIPLALELAAGRVDSLGLRTMAENLAGRYSLVMRGRRTAVPRHQTLRSMLDYSYDELSAREQRLFQRLGVLNTAAGLPWVVAMADGLGLTAPEVTEVVAGLVSKSLLDSDVSGSAARYRLLETARIYALEKLREAGEEAGALRRHAELVLAQLAAPPSGDAAFPAAEARPTDEQLLPELRAALDWAIGQEPALAARLTVAAVPLWSRQALHDECRERVSIVLDRCAAAVKADLLMAVQLYAALGGALLFTRDSGDAMMAAWETAAGLADALGDPEQRSHTFWGLWLSRHMNGSHRAALAAAERFATLPNHGRTGNDSAVGDRLAGTSLHILGEHAAARARIGAMLARYVTPADGSDSVRFQFDQRIAAESFLAQILWIQGEADQALALATAATARARAGGMKSTLAYALIHAACPVALQAGDLAALAGFVAELLDQAAVHGSWDVWGQCYQGALLVARGQAAEGADLLGRALARLPIGTYQHRYVAFLGARAEGLSAAGDHGAAAAAIEDALAQSDRTEVRWCLPELLRIKGETLVRAQGAAAAGMAKALYLRSDQSAACQGALAWRLRTAMSFARLHREQGSGRAAWHHLEEIRAQFSEGFASADLVASARLLAELEAELLPG